MPRKSKYTPARVRAIIEAKANGDTNEVAAIKGGISESQFYDWLRTKPEFSEAVKKAEREYERWEMQDLLKDARKSLKTLINGEVFEERQTEFEQNPRDPNKPRIRKQIIRTKRILPNPTAVIFTLVNRDPENWKNKQDTDVALNIENEEPPVIVFSQPEPPKEQEE